MSNPLLSYDEAAGMVARYADRLAEQRPDAERVPLGASQGRVLAESIVADRDQPPFDRSIRDGFACRAAEASSHAWLTISGSTRAGDAPPGALASGEAREIMTGAPVPAGADCVVMVEFVETSGGKVRLTAPRTIKAGDNFVVTGAQGRKGQLLLASGARLSFAQMALAASCGHGELMVYRRPRVAILTTGDEIVPISAEPKPGQIRNSNAAMLAAQVEAAGGEPWLIPHAADDAASLESAFALAQEADLLLATGGVSAGKYDLVEPVLEKLGARFHFTGVLMQPGKPVVFGELPRMGRANLPLFGLPGNPISSSVTFLLFVEPIVAALAGSTSPRPRFAQAVMGQETDRGGKPGLTRFLPAVCDFQLISGGTGEEKPVVNFVSWQGSGDLTALANSNCFLVVPEEVKFFEPGQKARILLY